MTTAQASGYDFLRGYGCVWPSKYSFAPAMMGVVHAKVDQKLVKSNKIASFNQCPKDDFWTQFLRIQMQFSDHFSICYSVSITLPKNHILILIKPFSFV
jgi:hypothetical protein